MSALAEKIAAAAPISFRDFMARALYDPAHGFYATGRARVGRRGDFFTSVSVGALFGKLLARQLAEMWARLGAPRAWTLVEQGADRGQLFADVLAALPAECARGARCVIIEPSAALRAAQRERLGDRVEWRESLEALGPFVGVHFSNELLDAFPVHLVERGAAGWVGKYVVRAGGRFVFCEGALSDARLAAELEFFQDAPVGFRAEIALDALDWMDALAGKLERGFVLAIDYGLTRAERGERPAGTLRGYAAQRRVDDVLATPGEVDLTAHVDFSRLIERAAERGLALAGFTDQHRFLTRLGVMEWSGDASQSRRDWATGGAFQTLMHPELMGAAFRAIAFQKNSSGALAGFGTVDFPREPGGDCAR